MFTRERPVAATNFERPLYGEPGGSGGNLLEVVVLHTTTRETLEALKTAACYARGLGARIRLLVLQVVPYPLPLTEPQIPVAFTKRSFCTVAAGVLIDTRVDIRLGRDRGCMLAEVLDEGSLVVIGGRRGRWLSLHNRLARRLERLGHQVIFSSTSSPTTRKQ